MRSGNAATMRSGLSAIPTSRRNACCVSTSQSASAVTATRAAPGAGGTGATSVRRWWRRWNSQRVRAAGALAPDARERLACRQRADDAGEPRHVGGEVGREGRGRVRIGVLEHQRPVGRASHRRAEAAVVRVGREIAGGAPGRRPQREAARPRGERRRRGLAAREDRLRRGEEGAGVGVADDVRHRQAAGAARASFPRQATSARYACQVACPMTGTATTSPTKKSAKPAPMTIAIASPQTIIAGTLAPKA